MRASQLPEGNTPPSNPWFHEYLQNAASHPENQPVSMIAQTLLDSGTTPTADDSIGRSSWLGLGPGVPGVGGAALDAVEGLGAAGVMGAGRMAGKMAADVPAFAPGLLADETGALRLEPGGVYDALGRNHPAQMSNKDFGTKLKTLIPGERWRRNGAVLNGLETLDRFGVDAEPHDIASRVHRELQVPEYLQARVYPNERPPAGNDTLMGRFSPPEWHDSTRREYGHSDPTVEIYPQNLWKAMQDSGFPQAEWGHEAETGVFTHEFMGHYLDWLRRNRFEPKGNLMQPLPWNGEYLGGDPSVRGVDGIARTMDASFKGFFHPERVRALMKDAQSDPELFKRLFLNNRSELQGVRPELSTQWRMGKELTYASNPVTGNPRREGFMRSGPPGDAGHTQLGSFEHNYARYRNAQDMLQAGHPVHEDVLKDFPELARYASDYKTNVHQVPGAAPSFEHSMFPEPTVNPPPMLGHELPETPGWGGVGKAAAGVAAAGGAVWNWLKNQPEEAPVDRQIASPAVEPGDQADYPVDELLRMIADDQKKKFPGKR